jgi:hypothetical protein
MAGTRPKGSSKRAPTVSGAVGGPSTGAGLSYQINCALLRLLQLFPEVLSLPARNPAIRLEPRELDGATVTRWDAGFATPWLHGLTAPDDIAILHLKRTAL